MEQLFAADKQLGKGGSSTVLLMTHKETGKHFAAKLFCKKKIMKDPKKLTLMDNEIKIMRKLHHKNIIELEGIYESDVGTFIVM